MLFFLPLSHVWIVAVKLSDPLPEFLQQSPNDVFTDSNSLTIYSPSMLCVCTLPFYQRGGHLYTLLMKIPL